MNEDRLYYPLSDAAEILRIKVNDLLHYGVQGVISIMVAVPEQLKVIQHQKRRAQGHVSVIFDAIHSPLFLALKPSYCAKVEATNETMQSEFPFGYYLPDLKDDKSVVGDLLKTYPGIETDSDEDPVHVWVTIGKPRGSHCWDNYIFEKNGASPDIGSPVRINISNLLLPKSDVNKIREILLKNEKEKVGRNAISTGTQEKTIKSNLDPAVFRNLAILVKVAEERWKDASPDERDTQPDNDEVIGYLRSKGFSINLAKAGSTIIRPMYAPKGGRRKDRDKRVK